MKNLNSELSFEETQALIQQQLDNWSKGGSAKQKAENWFLTNEEEVMGVFQHLSDTQEGMIEEVYASLKQS